MSFFDPHLLRSRHDTTITSYSRDITVQQHANYYIDTLTEWGAYWTSIFVRNSSDKKIIYRVAPYAVPRTVMPESEYNVQGWGSYFELASLENEDVYLSFNLVDRQDALL